MTEPLSREERFSWPVPTESEVYLRRYEATVQREENRAEQLAAALWEYGRHRASCAYLRANARNDCDCGLDAALAG